jgi:hypothetical protein
VFVKVYLADWTENRRVIGSCRRKERLKINAPKQEWIKGFVVKETRFKFDQS